MLVLVEGVVEILDSDNVYQIQKQKLVNYIMNVIANEKSDYSSEDDIQARLILSYISQIDKMEVICDGLIHIKPADIKFGNTPKFYEFLKSQYS